jgi:hypothetical protein
MRLLLVLHWLRSYLKYADLAEMYEVSVQLVHRDILHIVPILAAHLDEIHWPSPPPAPHGFESVRGAIDCTSHYRQRPLNEWLYYRGDKRRHFLSAQVITDLRGRLLDLEIVLGHNNDQGAFNLTGTGDRLIAEDVRLLADGGYRHTQLVTPDTNASEAWTSTHTHLRSVVEHTIGMAKTWAAAALPFKQIPPIQAPALMAVYNLTNMKIKQAPLRPEYE